ncbi:hypothetical protein RDWZM_004838 [Blomia tropicalis]|uniref:DFP2 n=1 Tax=Blomia tropicalis TaxID=40697 RepID=A0A9Q0RMY5_BLOTA|nr:hypothetical protein RDWZM_004838 [Blomia tropicalis]
MKYLLLPILLTCQLWHGSSAYYNLDQVEQKYEQVDSEPNYFSNQDQASSMETYGPMDGYNSAEQQSYSGNSGYGENDGGKSGEYSKMTHIPSGTLFPLNGKGPLEFQSPFSKQPYSIVFRTHSMPVKIKQQHQAMPAPEVEFVRSQEEPHQIKHEVIRPIIQEVHEIIMPYRRVVQEVKPVVEQIHTIVSKGESRNRGGGGGGSGIGNGGGNIVSSSMNGGGGGYGSGQGNLGYGSENVPRYTSASTTSTTNHHHHQSLQHHNQQTSQYQHQQPLRSKTTISGVQAPIASSYPISQYSPLSSRRQSTQQLSRY